ncbi:MAG: ABC transporter permease [Anaerolineae bacterium]|nr:ABC transporter permease [Anaerolineae bacterium]
MHKILSIAWKETIIRFSSRTELLFFLILPIAFTFILSDGLAGDPSEGTQSIELLVVNVDDSELAQTLVDGIDATSAVRVALVSAETAADQFADGATAVLTIPTGFGAAVNAGEAVTLDLQKEPDNNDATIVEQTVNAVIGSLNQPLAIAQAGVAFAEQTQPFADTAARDTFFVATLDRAQTLLADAPSRFVVTKPDGSISEEASFDVTAHQSAGQLVTWVFIPLLGVAAVFAFERNHGTLRRLLTTPTTKSTQLLGIVSGHVGHAIVQMLLLMVFGAVVLQVDWGKSPLGLVIMMLSFGLAGVALGTMLGTLIKTTSQASSVAILLGMAMALLGGCWFPLEIFPPAAQTVARFLPTTWAMEGFSNLLAVNTGIDGVLVPAAVLLGFAVVFFGVGVWRFRYE